MFDRFIKHTGPKLLTPKGVKVECDLSFSLEALDALQFIGKTPPPKEALKADNIKTVDLSKYDRKTADTTKNTLI